MPTYDIEKSHNRNLKPVIIPFEITEAFISLAEANTSRKIETCAILAGNCKNDNYIIDTLIVPKQGGEHDCCYMEDEVQMFETQMREGVMTIGWIHTHPQFDIFLSSVDLHNQLGYQQQLQEAVAIVYSPIKKERYRALRCKDSVLQDLMRCNVKGFHEHKDANRRIAFEECSHAIYVDGKQNGIKTKIIDLRY